MNINRHNYEEFFILYWDNELNAEQKRLVEDFVQQHADLKEEFRLFGETRFDPEANISFDNKELLAVDKNAFINLSNYGEKLILYIDDELTTGQRAAVEKFTTLHPSAKKELALLQKTKLQPKAGIAFPDKSVLYKKEEKPDSYRFHVIRMNWLRVAVAAAIIIVAGFVTYRMINTGNDEGKIEFVKTGNPNNPSVNVNPEQAKGNPTADIAKKSTPEQPEAKKKEKRPGFDNKLSNSIAVRNPENKNNLPKEGKLSGESLLSPDNAAIAANLPDIKRKDFGAAQRNESGVINAAFDNSDVTLQPGYALNIKSPVIIDGGEKEGGGLKGFLRKTTRVFERRTNVKTTTDDNKLLVGMFAVSLK
jgi:hypothetical protein